MQKMSIVIDVQGKMFETCVNEKFLYPGGDPKLTLTLTLTLTLGLGLGLTSRKTIGVENLKRNAKDAYCEKRLEKNLFLKPFRIKKFSILEATVS